MAQPNRKIIPFSAPPFAVYQNNQYAFKRPGAERALLSALLVLPSEFETVIRMIGTEPALFTELLHRQLWTAMLKLHQDRQPIDPVLMVDLLDGVGDQDRNWWSLQLAKLGIGFTSTQGRHVLKYAKSVKAASVRQQLDQALQEARRIVANGNYPDDLVPDQGETLQEIFEAFRDAPPERAGGSALVTLNDDVRERQENPHAKRMTIPTGFVGLDKSFGGWQRGLLHVVGGMSNIGKTGAMLSFLLDAALRDIPVAYYGFVDGDEQLTAMRFLSMLSGIPANAITNGSMTPAQYEDYKRAYAKFQTLPIYIDDHSNTVPKIEQNLRTLQSTEKVELAAIDYYQRLEIDGFIGDKYPLLTRVSRSLVTMGKNLKIPLIVGAQVPSAVGQRNDPRPGPYDIGECTRIVDDLDVLIHVHRPNKFDKNASPTLGEFIINKLRGSGNECTVDVHFNSDTGLFQQTGHVKIDPDAPIQPGDPNDVPF